MNYREAARYTNRSTIELKTELEDILEAMEAIGFNQDITYSILDFWLHGSLPVNYTIFMDLLNTEEMLKKHGIPPQHIKNALNDDAALDKYLLFKNACLNFIGEPLTSDFKDLIINAINKIYVKRSEDSEKEKQVKIIEARNTIKAIAPSIRKTIAELNKIEAPLIAGTFEESIFFKLQQIEDLIVNQIEQ